VKLGEKRVWLGFLAIIIGLSAVTVTASASDDPANELKAAYIVDADTGQAVYADHADTKLPIASLSKLMTLDLVVHAVKSGQIKWTDNVPISDQVRKLAESATLSTMPMAEHDKFTVKELFAATLVGSSNSSAIALGELVGGSNAKFIQLMNEQAKRWQLEAHFVSASGLDNTDLTKYHYNLPGTSDQAQNLVSARAITMVARHLLRDDPEVITIANQAAVKVHNYRVPTSVKILKGQSEYDATVPVDGLKTGYTAKAGACLVATFKHGGHRMIATTLGGAWQYTASANLRAQVQQQERYQRIAPATIDYQIPGTSTKVKLMAKTVPRRWVNVRQPLQQTEVPVLPLKASQPNYLGKRMTVMQLRLTDPTAGTMSTVDYVTTRAQVLPGPMQLATTVKTSARIHSLRPVEY